MQKIGKYEIREELGRGGMGVVYKAYDEVLERDVALKVIPQAAVDVPDVKARFYREARMAGKLSHDAIAVIYEVGEDQGLPFIVMEYLPGIDLRSVIDREEQPPFERKLDYAKQICRGLQYAHEKNVIHRDIKPENIKVLDDGRIKIIDFGIAKPYTPVTASDETGTHVALTRMGIRVGTPWYMSPEQVKGNPVDKRTDIFSFGVVLYELLTRRRPFQGDDVTVLYKILHEEPPPMELGEDVPSGEVRRIVSRCLAKDHEERYGDCSQLLRDLHALGTGSSADPRISDLMASGVALEKAEQHAEASVKFDQVLELDPGNVQARMFLKRLALRDKDAFMRRVLAGNVVGTIITHFRILDRIGGGGMGVVYKAEDLSLKRTVALKFLMPDLVRDPSAKKRFLIEAQAASALDDPNICTVHEISETPEGLLFICMAYYGGENLSARIVRGPLSVAEALDICISIGRGLARAHERGIVHRDIKPANIIITADGGVKIVDFGLAKLSGGPQVTRVGAQMGTLPFMSPEQVRGLEIDHRTDIWSLAVLLFQALTGQLPFERETEDEVLHAIVSDDPPALGSLRSGLPDRIERVLKKAFKKDAGARYATIQEFVEALEDIRSRDVKISAAPSRAKAPTGLQKNRKAQAERPTEDFLPAHLGSPRRSRVNALRWTLGLAVLVVLALLVVLLLPRKSKEPAYSRLNPAGSDSSSALNGVHQQPTATQREPGRGEAPGAGSGSHDGEDRVHAAPPGESIEDLRNLAVGARKEMLVERSAAEAAGGQTLAGDLFAKALSLEHEGDTGIHRDDRSSLQSSGLFYSQAKDAYGKVIAEAAFVNTRKTDADAHRGSMNLAKQRVPGSDQERKTSAAYQNGLDAEGAAKRLYQAGDYAGARDGFEKAEAMYGGAEKEVGAALGARMAAAGSVAKGPEEKEAGEKNAWESATREISGMLKSYKENIEQGNLAGITSLLGLSTGEQQAWADFFKRTRERRMSLEDQQIVRLDAGRARVTFTEKLSYEDEEDVARAKEWTVALSGGRWKVTAHR